MYWAMVFIGLTYSNGAILYSPDGTLGGVIEWSDKERCEQFRATVPNADKWACMKATITIEKDDGAAH